MLSAPSPPPSVSRWQAPRTPGLPRGQGGATYTGRKPGPGMLGSGGVPMSVNLW